MAAERFGFEPLRGRLFDKGALKLLILDLLRDRPRHGYEIIHALRERFGGFYAPSPGAIYPALRWLEARGYVRATQQVGRTVYSILEEGRTFLTEQEHLVAEIWGRASAWSGPALRSELQALRQEARRLAGLFGRIRPGQVVDLDKLRRIRAVIARAVREIEAILAEERSSPGAAPG